MTENCWVGGKALTETNKKIRSLYKTPTYNCKINKAFFKKYHSQLIFFPLLLPGIQQPCSSNYILCTSTFLRHFIEYALLRGSEGTLCGARGEALWQEMVLGHFKGLE